MARDNIFNKLSKRRDYHNEILRIEKLLNDKNGIAIETIPDIPTFGAHKIDYFRIIDFVDSFSFKAWKHRNRCINCVDMRNELGLAFVISDDYSIETDAETFLNYIEYAANILYLVNFAVLSSSYKWRKTDIYNAACSNIDDCLGWLNYDAHKIQNQQRVLVVESNAATTAVAEIVNEDLAFEIIHYNHFMLKGDIETKKAILLKLYEDLEPKRKQVSTLDSQLADNIFFLMNNINLRHNNRSKKDKNYKEYVAKMRKSKLEEWYDELYQMILLAYLELDQHERNERVKELKSNIVGGNTNG